MARSPIPEDVWAEVAAVYPTGGVKAAKKVLADRGYAGVVKPNSITKRMNAYGHHKLPDEGESRPGPRPLAADPLVGDFWDEEQEDLPFSIRRRCMNRDCIERFTPVNDGHWYHHPDCRQSERLWTKEEILAEEGSLYPEASGTEMAARAFGQKNRLQRRVQQLTSQREFLKYHVSKVLTENPWLRFEPMEPAVRLAPGGARRPREIVLIVSDWQIGKMENGIGVQAFIESRFPRIVEATIAIIQRVRASGHPVERVHLVPDGDMIEGCLPAGTLVDTPRGPKRVEEFVPGDYVWALGSSGLEEARVSEAAMTGVDPIYTIRTRDRTLRANGEHPVLVMRKREASGSVHAARRRYQVGLEYVPAREVSPGDLAVVPEGFPDIGSTMSPVGEVSIELMEFLGLYLGDGCLSYVKGVPAGINIAHAPKARYIGRYLDNALKVFSKADGSPVVMDARPATGMTRFASRSAAKLVLDAGFGGLAKTKRVPDWVFELRRDFRLAFLRGYLDADGHVTSDGTVVMASCNRALIDDLRHLCDGLGFLATEVHDLSGKARLPGGREVDRELYRFTLGSPSLHWEVGSHDPEDSARLKAGASRNRRRPEYKTDLKGWVSPPDGCRYSKVLDVKVSEIAEPVYNITVEGLHNFVANGLVTHNCFIYAGQNVTGLDRQHNSHRLIKQIHVTAQLLAKLAQELAAHVAEVVVHSVPGNHGRTNGKNDFSDPEDNFDTLVSFWARDICQNLPNVVWDINEGWFGRFNVFDHEVVAQHGDAWNGPVTKLESLLPQWVTGNVFGVRPDLLISAHRHSFCTFEVNGITVVQNGTADGGSLWYTRAYGRSSRPIQTVIVSSPDRVVEDLCPIFLDENER